MESTTKEKILSGLFWKLIERGGAQGIQFIVLLILARLLMPRDYGTIAIITVFINLANLFIQGGFNTALIQKKNIDEVDLSSVFYLSLTISSLLYVILFITSPFIAQYYNMTELKSLIRVLSITLFFGAIISIQIAVLSKEMQFKKFFIGSLGGLLISAIVGISMAIKGYGVWALVGQQLSNNICLALILWMIVKWRPKLLFSLKKIKSLFSFGWKILCSNLLSLLFTDVYTLIIGKIYNRQTLGYYNRGIQIPSIISVNITSAISSVMLPAFSLYKDDKNTLKTMVRRSIVTSSFINFPIMIGLCAASNKLIEIILTQKWLPAVPFVQMACILFAFSPLHSANMQAINALGRSDVYLKNETQKKIVEIIILLISINFGIYIMAAGRVVASIIAIFINASPNKEFLNYGYKEQLKDIAPSFVLACLMGIFIYLIGFVKLNSILVILIQFSLGFIFYIQGAIIFRIESYKYLKNTISSIFLKTKSYNIE